MTTYVLCKTDSSAVFKPGIKVIIGGLRGHLLHTVTLLFFLKGPSGAFVTYCNISCFFVFFFVFFFFVRFFVVFLLLFSYQPL